MSKPLAAKGVGACLKHVLYTRLLSASPRQSRGDGINGHEGQYRRGLPDAMRLALGSARLPLDKGDPLPPDHDLIGSSRDVLGELYRAERPGLLRFLARRTPGDRAEDIVQQLFAHMAGKTEGQADAIVSPGAYLREAARNLLRDEARSAARTSRHLHMSIEDVPLCDGDPVATLEARDRLARLEQAVLRLKPLTQQIFLARRLDGYSYAEIAQRTGLSIRGVEKQMSRAIKQLGRHLRHHD